MTYAGPSNSSIVGMPQTNNNIEAYNLKLKIYLGNAHPDLYKSVGVFRDLELEANQKYIAARDGIPAPYRKKIDLKHSTDLSMLKKLLKENLITIDEYIENILDMYDFEALKCKEKNKISIASAFLSDSSDSDELNDSNSSSSSSSD